MTTLGDVLKRAYLNKAHPFKVVFAELIDGKLSADSPIELGWWYEQERPGLVRTLTFEEIKLALPEADNDPSVLIELMDEVRSMSSEDVS